MPRNTRIIGYIESSALASAPATPHIIKGISDAVVKHGIPVSPTSTFQDGSIAVDISVAVRPEFNADEFGFANSLMNMLDEPQMQKLKYHGEFMMVTDGFPLPIIMHVGVEDSKVYASRGRVVWGEQIPITKDCLI
jgi:hypothetical protein